MVTSELKGEELNIDDAATNCFIGALGSFGLGAGAAAKWGHLF